MEFLNKFRAIIDISEEKVILTSERNKKYVFKLYSQVTINQTVTLFQTNDPKNCKFAKNYHQKCVEEIGYILKKINKQEQSTREGQRAGNLEILYRDFYYKLNNNKLKFTTELTEKVIDIFTLPTDTSLAHCVAEDMKMGRGIAKDFKEKFNGVKELLSQNEKVGGLAVLPTENRVIYYLVTKKYSHNKPTYIDLFESLKKLKNHMEEFDIKKLAMPKIGCGLDRLDWKIVKPMIQYIFSDTDIQIQICIWNPMRHPIENKNTRNNIYETRTPCIQYSSNLIEENSLDSAFLSLSNIYQGKGEVINKMIKAKLAKCYIIKPQEEISLEIIIDDLRKNILANQNFKINEKFLVTKRLIATTGLYFMGSTLSINVKSKSTKYEKLYKNSTVGYLLEKSEAENEELIMMYTGEDEERVTLKDHKLEHIENTSVKENLFRLLDEYNDIFSKSIKYMGRTDLTEHKIEVGEAMPIKSRPYRVSQKEREIITEQIEDMRKYNIIKPCHSPWSSPVVLVKKKDGERRFCVDYRKLNEVTKKTTYPLPNIDDILTYLGPDNAWFSTLDMHSGYWQVPVAENSKQYTAFVAQGHGSYNFEVLPFGLCGAPGTFQELADKVFEGMKWKDILIYLDDIIIFSKTEEEHLDKLQRVFQRLREAGLTLKPSKCEYLRKDLRILGFKVSEEGILPDTDNVAAIKNFPRPKSLKNVQSFLGLCNFYRKFIRNYSVIARPLHDLTKKNNKFTWGETQQNAFDKLKQHLMEAPVLHHFNPNKGTILHVDASRSGIGGVLLQENDNGEEHPIAYVSRSLLNHEKNYLTISELEGLAVVWILSYLRHLIYGRPIKIYTDHSALCWLKTIKNEGRLARWALKLAEFDYTIQHKKGCNNKDADCLSRNPPENSSNLNRKIDIDEIPTLVLDIEDLNTLTLKRQTDLALLLNTDEISKLQEEDNEIRKIKNAILNPQNADIGTAKRAKQFIIKNNTLFKKNNSQEGLEDLLVIPRKYIGEILFQLHSEPLSGHLGLTKTLQKIKSRFYWTTMHRDIVKYVKGCRDCQTRKGIKKKPAGLLQPIQIGTPFEQMGIDLLGPFRRSKNGKTMIIVCTDYATRYVEAAALPSGKAEPVAKFILQNIITRHGSPKYILSDRGKTFQSELVTELLRIMGTANRYTTSYHPSCNGLTERFNKTLADMLAMFTNTNQTDWDMYIPHCVWAYNTSKQATTKFSPFELVYARYPILPTEANLLEEAKVREVDEIRQRALAVRNLAVENIRNQQKLDKKRYDERHRHIEFNPGDQVKVFTPIRKVGRSEKLLLRWFGPYYVIRKIGEVDYEIKKGRSENAKTDIIHVSRILPYNDPWSPMPEEEEEKDNEIGNPDDKHNTNGGKESNDEVNLLINSENQVNNIIEVENLRAHTILPNKELEVELAINTRGRNVEGQELNEYKFTPCTEIQGKYKYYVPSSHPYVQGDKWYIKLGSLVDYPIKLVEGTLIGILESTDKDVHEEECYNIIGGDEQIAYPEKQRKFRLKAGDKVKWLSLQEDKEKNRTILRWQEEYTIIEGVKNDMYIIQGISEGKPTLVTRNELLPCC